MQPTKMFKLVASNSKIFSSLDSLRESHYLELISLTIGIKTFWPYLSHSSKRPIIFTDAKNLLKVRRLSERSILASNLIHYLDNVGKVLNYGVFHIPGKHNYLADLLSRSYSESRFVQNSTYKMSKDFALAIPTLPERFYCNSELLHIYLSSDLLESPEDTPLKRNNV